MVPWVPKTAGRSIKAENSIKITAIKQTYTKDNPVYPDRCFYRHFSAGVSLVLCAASLQTPDGSNKAQPSPEAVPIHNTISW